MTRLDHNLQRIGVVRKHLKELNCFCGVYSLGMLGNVLRLVRLHIRCGVKSQDAA